MNEVNNFKVLEPKAKGSYNKGIKMNPYFLSEAKKSRFSSEARGSYISSEARNSRFLSVAKGSYFSFKRKIPLLFLFCLILWWGSLFSTPVEAVEIPNPLKAKTIEEFIQYLIDFVFFLALALVPLMIIIAGFYWLTSAGEPKRIQTAKDIILYTSIGLGIILLAKALISVIISALGG